MLFSKLNLLLYALGCETHPTMFWQEAYWSMASALSEADGIDYTDPKEVSV